jgi:hypothetical protein
MDIYKKNYRNEYKNPYRHGVCIGNYVEDTFGEDLKKLQETQSINPKIYTSESKDRYRWPELKENQMRDRGNNLTKNHNSNFDLNIDLTPKNVEDYLKLHNTNYFQLKDKNSFLTDQIKTESQIKKFQETMTGISTQNDILSETQTKLKSFHQNDARGLLDTGKSGLVKNLYFGHGLDQNNFTKNEYASTYQ